MPPKNKTVKHSSVTNRTESREEAEREITTKRGMAERDRSKLDLVQYNSIKPLTFRKKRSASVTRKSNFSKKRTPVSADDLTKLHPDDYTKHLRSLWRLKKNKGTLYDRVQLLPTHLQDQINSMAYEKVKVNRADVEIIANYPKMLKNILRNNFRKELDLLCSGNRMPTVINEDEFRTSQFYTIFREEENLDNENTIKYIYTRKGDRLFARTSEKFIKKTFVEYQQIGDFIRFRVLPKDKTLRMDTGIFKDMYDGFILIHSEDPSSKYAEHGTRVKEIIKQYFKGSDGIVESDIISGIEFQNQFPNQYPDVDFRIITIGCAIQPDQQIARQSTYDYISRLDDFPELSQDDIMYYNKQKYSPDTIRSIVYG